MIGIADCFFCKASANEPHKPDCELLERRRIAESWGVKSAPERFGEHVMDPSNDPERRTSIRRVDGKDLYEISGPELKDLQLSKKELLETKITQQHELLNSAAPVQAFATGATRSDDTFKPDFEGFLSPLVLQAYADYMTEHRVQDDGTVRESDNWQRGMPFHKYMKSLWRHFMQLWKLHRGWPVEPEKRAGKLVPVTVTSAVAGILFNTMGYFHEYLKDHSAWTNRIISEYKDGTVVRGKDVA